MTIITRNGIDLADSLFPSFEKPIARGEVQETCSLICRHGASIKRLAERDCNQGLSDAERETDKMHEARIRELVATLPKVNGEAIRAEFQGDPRGSTVKLVMPDGRGDSFGGGGRMCVPGS